MNTWGKGASSCQSTSVHAGRYIQHSRVHIYLGRWFWGRPSSTVVIDASHYAPPSLSRLRVPLKGLAFPSRLPVGRSVLSLFLRCSHRSISDPTAQRQRGKKAVIGTRERSRQGAEGREGNGPHRSLALNTYFPPFLMCVSRTLCVFSPLISELSCRTEYAMTARLNVLHER